MAEKDGGHLLIRDCRPDDVETLHEIDRACFPAFMAYSRAEFRFHLLSPGAAAKVAELGGRIVGFAIGRIGPGPGAHVITLDVVPEARRCKVGTALMETLHSCFRSRGCLQAMLEVDTRNAGAQAFYERLGYVRRALIAGYYSGRRDAYRMTLAL